MNITQAIHEKIDNSVDFLLDRIKKDSIEDYLGSFTKDAFSGLLNKYKLKYPQNSFITEKQIKEICLEYDLKFGNMFAFVGEIPKKNKKQLHEYISPQHKMLDIDFMLTQLNSDNIMRFLCQNFRGDAYIRHDWEIDETILDLRGSVPGFSPHKFIIPFAKNVAVHFDTQAVTRVYNSFTMREAFSFGEKAVSILVQDQNYNSAQIYVDPHLCKINEVIMESGRIDGMFSRNRFQMSLTTTIDISINLHKILRRVSDAIYNENYIQDYKVIAPGNMFNTAALKETDGYRYSIDELAIMKPSIFVDDPIILDPVEGGYLVITKWGEEAKLVENSSSN